MTTMTTDATLPPFDPRAELEGTLSALTREVNRTGDARLSEALVAFLGALDVALGRRAEARKLKQAETLGEPS